MITFLSPGFGGRARQLLDENLAFLTETWKYVDVYESSGSLEAIKIDTNMVQWGVCSCNEDVEQTRRTPTAT